MTSYLKTAILLAALTAIFMGTGFLLAGEGGMLIALALAAAMNLFAWWNSGSTVLRYYKAQEVAPNNSLHRIVSELVARDGMPMPKVYVIENPQPNAFATGRGPENASVAATTGLLQLMNEREVAGVMAHELAHVKNRDTLIMTVTATLAGALSMLANFALFFGGGDDRERPGGLIGTLALMILAPMAAGLVQMAISRTREYDADRVGAEIARDPHALASALQKIEAYAKRIHNPTAERNPASGQLFIINPLAGRGADNLFSTHPNTGNRVRALTELAMKMGGGAPRPAAPAAPSFTATTSVPNAGHRRGPWG